MARAPALLLFSLCVCTFVIVQYVIIAHFALDTGAATSSTVLGLGNRLFGESEGGYQSIAVAAGSDSGAPQRAPCVCIIGNAQSTDSARAFHASLDGGGDDDTIFPAVWVVWGPEITTTTGAWLSLSASSSSSIHFLSLPNSTWAQGIAAGYAEFQHLRRRCEYYFVVDDDARFSMLASNDEDDDGGRAAFVRRDQQRLQRQRQEEKKDDDDRQDDAGRKDDDDESEDTAADITSTITSTSSKDDPAVTQEILALLRDHSPAVLSFAWENGLRNSPALRSTYKIFRDEPMHVQPLTGFDNGNIIYHESLMPLLLPFPPHHEGPWHGEWTLSATWLQLFLPRMYLGKAMVARTVLYSNKLNFNANGAGRVTIDEASGLATHEGSRHPYEWPLKKSYAAYLAAGLKEAGARVGADMGLEDVGGAITPSATGEDFTDFLKRINGFYDLLHPAVAERPYVKERHSRHQLLELRRATPIVFKLFVFTMDRPASLRRLVRSLLLARYDLLEDTRAVDLTILVDLPATAAPTTTTAATATNSKAADASDPEATQASVIDYVRTIAWPHGRLVVRAAGANMGLKRCIMEAWTPTSADEFAVFLEDDIEVSPYFAYWAERAVRAYHYGQDRPLHTDRMVGVSLYAPRWSQGRDMPWSPEAAEARRDDGGAAAEDLLGRRAPRYEPYLFQLPCSWGAVYFPRPWASFLRWHRRHGAQDPLVPDLVGINRWPHERSWKKYLVRFMVETGGFMLYPHLPDGLSLSTNHMEVGANEMRKGLSAFVERYNVPLLQGPLSSQQLARMMPLPALEYLRAFDIYEHPTRLVATTGRRVAGTTAATTLPVVLPDLLHLPLPTAAMQRFAKFTIVVPSYGPRVARLATFIRHYEALPSLDRILVVWNGGPVPRHLVSSSNRTTVEVLSMKANDLNNRFLPHKELRTSAVLSLDDDVLIDVEDVEFAFYTWQLNPRNLIGFRWTTRGYMASNDTPATMATPTKAASTCAHAYRSPVPRNLTLDALAGYQMALTGAAFVHVDHLRAYSSTQDARLTRVRDEVRRLSNCEDIAMNFLVAEAMGQGPIVVEGAFNKTAMVDGDGLWKRPNHYETRSNCICSMERLFGSDMPLKNVVAFPQVWQPEWAGRPRVPPPRDFDMGSTVAAVDQTNEWD